MDRVSACARGAVGPAPRADVAVLRLSAVDRVWCAVRWTLALAGAVVVLWFGAAFLAAAPAAAAATIPVQAAAAGVVKTAGTREIGRASCREWEMGLGVGEDI